MVLFTLLPICGCVCVHVCMPQTLCGRSSCANGVECVDNICLSNHHAVLLFVVIMVTAGKYVVVSLSGISINLFGL
jgi:hypothetical protein